MPARRALAHSRSTSGRTSSSRGGATGLFRRQTHQGLAVARGDRPDPAAHRLLEQRPRERLAVQPLHLELRHVVVARVEQLQPVADGLRVDGRTRAVQLLEQAPRVGGQARAAAGGIEEHLLEPRARRRGERVGVSGEVLGEFRVGGLAHGGRLVEQELHLLLHPPAHDRVVALQADLVRPALRVDPALDDLHAVEVRAVGVAHGAEVP